jgi:hypothetical protein
MMTISVDQTVAPPKPGINIPKTLMMAVLFAGLVVGAFLGGRLLERSQLADTDMDWLGSTDARIFAKAEWAAQIDDIVFSSMKSRSAGAHLPVTK